MAFARQPGCRPDLGHGNEAKGNPRYPPMKTQTFIFVHDQNIILDCVRLGKFSGIGHVTYMFLGRGDASLVNGMANVIVCRDLPVNIEEYPKLTSFSGWYAIWKNKLYTGDFLNLFEYDVELSKDFSEVLEREIESGANIVGYVSLGVHNPLFIKDPSHIGNLLEAIRDKHNVDALAAVGKMGEREVCSRTSNHTFKKELFERYMEWMEPMIGDIKTSPMAGHHFERSISLFYLLNPIANIRLCPRILEHSQANSHKTYPFRLERDKPSFFVGNGRALAGMAEKALQKIAAAVLPRKYR